MSRTYNEGPIDFVVPWVDGNDEKWQREKNQYAGQEQSSIDSSYVRYRDYGLLKYWFRGVEEFAPWVNRIFLITNGQLPSWINLEADKLIWVKHEDYIPPEFLPTFSANPIELPLHRIEKLSDKFVYFNDDFFLIRPVSESQFFKKGLPLMNPCVSLTVPKHGYDQFAHLMLNNVMVINSHFKARKVIRHAMANWLSPFRVGFKSASRNWIPLCLGSFPGFSNPHLPSPFLKTVCEEVWMQEETILTNTMKHRFRSNDDVTQYLFYDWHLVSKQFVPQRRKKMGHYYSIQSDMTSNKEIIKAVRNQTHPVICINDSSSGLSVEEFDRMMSDLQRSFESILPRKSSFEK